MGVTMKVMDKAWYSIVGAICVLMLLRVELVQTSEACPTGCQCQFKTSQRQAVCEGTIDNRTLSELPPTTTHLLVRIDDASRSTKQVLPVSVSQMTQLQVLLLDVLNVHGTAHYTLDRHSFAVDNTLKIFHSRIQLLVSADALSSLQSLESLRLTGTAMNWTSLSLIVAESLCDKTSLKKLSLAQFSRTEQNSPFEFSPRDVFARCRMSTVQHLDLSGNRIRYIKPGFLATFPGLRVMNLERNLLTSTGYFNAKRSTSSYSTLEFALLPLHTFRFGEQGRESSIQREFTESDLLSAENFTIPQPKIKCNHEKNMYWLLRIDFRKKDNKHYWDPISNLCFTFEIITLQNMKATFNMSTIVYVALNVPNSERVPLNGLSYVDASDNDFLYIHSGYSGSNNITALNRMFLVCSQLKYLNLQATNFPTILYKLSGNTQLETLLLGRNPKVGKSIANIGDDAFNHPTLKSLDLASNNIAILPDTFLGSLPSLHHLNLSSNQLHDFTSNLSAYPHLQFLNLRNNSISGLSIWKNIRVMNNLTIDISDNPLQCGCQDIEFLEWFQETSVRFYNFDNLTCFHPFNGFVAMNRVDVKALHKWCYPSITRLVLISVFCTSMFFLALGLAFVLYRKRWKIRFWWFATKSSWRRIQTRSDIALYDFDAFVAHDYDDFGWIQQYLVPKLEDENNLKLSFGEKDFPAGSILEEVIVDFINRSRKTLLLLTPKFIQSHWCDFEVGMASNQLLRNGVDVIVAVILKPLPMDSINGTLYNILKKKIYLEWNSEDIDAQRLFWAKLVVALKN